MADTLRVFINRLIKKRNPFVADKTHIHHLFVRLGYSHKKCTIITSLFSFFMPTTGVILSFCFNDTVCIAIIILSWFLYLYLLRKITLKNIHKLEILDQKAHNNNGNK